MLKTKNRSAPEGSQPKRLPLFRMFVLAIPLAIIGALVSFGLIAVYKDAYDKPLALAEVTQFDSTAVLGEEYCPPPATGIPPNCQPPAGYQMPTTCPSGYTGTPPNCQPTSSAPIPSTPPSSVPPPSSSSPSSGSYQTPTTCPSGYTGTPPNCQPTSSSGGSSGSSGSTSTNTTINPNTSSGSGQSGSSYQPPPTISVSNTEACMIKVFGADLAAKLKSGSVAPSPAQMAQAQSCFSAQVYSGPGPSGSANSGPGSYSSGQSDQNPQSGALAYVQVAPPPQFQADSPTVACAKSIMGDRYGSQPSPDLIAQVQAKCFGQTSSGSHIGLISTSSDGRDVRLIGPPAEIGKAGTPPSLPAEVKACVLKAGMNEAVISAIQRGQPPTAAQQAAGEGCFKKYAEDKGYALPILTPPDPTQPFDPNSKQNQCVDLVAQAKGIRVSQLTPGVVASWSPDDIAKMRSCYGVAAAASGTTASMAFAPTSPQVAVSSAKLNCIQTALGADKLAAVMAGISSLNDNERKSVYDKCINLAKIAAGANPALLGLMAAMPPSDLEGQFIPINAQAMPSPSAKGATSVAADAAISVEGVVEVAAGQTLPTKVDVFIKSTPLIYTVALKKVSNTKATWSVNVTQNKLAVGNHKAYAVATLADASQMRSPDTTFAVAAKTIKNNWVRIVEGVILAAVLAVGGWFGWKWHLKHHHAKP